MSMRKRRKHCAGILGRDKFTRSMWRYGINTKHYYTGKYWLHLTFWDTQCWDNHETTL
jgi:hypothetical protein